MDCCFPPLYHKLHTQPLEKTVKKSSLFVGEGITTHEQRSTVPLRYYSTQEIPPESLHQLSLSLTAPELVKDRGR